MKLKFKIFTIVTTLIALISSMLVFNIGFAEWYPPGGMGSP